jgi:hypothetical protein
VGEEKDALTVGDGLLVAQDAVVVLLPHIDVNGPVFIVQYFFGRPLDFGRGLSEVVRLIFVVQDLMDFLALQINERNTISVQK